MKESNQWIVKEIDSLPKWLKVGQWPVKMEIKQPESVDLLPIIKMRVKMDNLTMGRL